jgi:hypothetical protein
VFRPKAVKGMVYELNWTELMNESDLLILLLIPNRLFREERCQIKARNELWNAPHGRLYKRQNTEWQER